MKRTNNDLHVRKLKIEKHELHKKTQVLRMGSQFLLHYKTLVRKLKIEKHEFHKSRCSGWVSSSSFTTKHLSEN